MHIRAHRRDDADRIAEILAAGWTAYSDFMPVEVLAPRIDPQQRKAEIAGWLDTEFDAANEAIFVADDGVADGFIHMELGDKGDLGAVGIVNLLYVDPAAHRRGYGRALMASGAEWLLSRASGPLVLSALVDNPNRHAYRAMGGREAKNVVSRYGSHELNSVLYLWPNPAVLLSGRPMSDPAQ